MMEQNQKIPANKDNTKKILAGIFRVASDISASSGYVGEILNAYQPPRNESTDETLEGEVDGGSFTTESAEQEKLEYFTE